ncbi:MAG: hypothetical protein ABR573_09665 [Candidatus Dormibacteria bacterium]
MAGPAISDPSRRLARPFSQATADDVPAALGIMGILHSEPLASAFNRLLANKLSGDDAVSLTHFFEEVAVLVNHRRVAEDLVYDMLALDLYWDQLQKSIERTRKSSGNAKFGENFEIAAQSAAEYREQKPSKLG